MNNQLSINYGIGAFETMYFDSSGIEYLQRHLKRLMEALEIIRIEGISINQLQTNVMNELQKSNLKSGIIKLLVNETGISISFRENPYTYGDYQTGFKLTKSEVKVPMQSRYTIKSTNYMVNYFELLRAKEAGFNEVLFFNDRLELVEGSRSNIFLVNDEVISTPPLSSGCLSGIMRRVLIEKERLIVEKNLTEEDLLQADSVFITNSVMGVMPVKSYMERSYDLEHTSVQLLIDKYFRKRS
jgi:4-amino-4-deoxychorismate lyase